MQFEYEDTKVKKIITDTKLLQKKVGLEIGKSLKKRMNQLQAVNDFNEYLTKIKLGSPHMLSGNLEGLYAISITANYRLVVEPLIKKLDVESLKECKVIKIKGVLEYHGGKNEWIIP